MLILKFIALLQLFGWSSLWRCTDDIAFLFDFVKYFIDVKFMPSTIHTFNCTIQCFLVYSQRGAATANLRTFSFPLKNTCNRQQPLCHLVYHRVPLCWMFWGTAKFFPSQCIVLLSYQECVRVPVSPPPCYCLALSLACLVCLKWHITVILIDISLSHG